MCIAVRVHGKRMARILTLGALVAIAVAAGAEAVLADDSINTGYFGGVAIMGYDPVAYFTDNKAVKGSEKYSYEWLGTPWHFASRKHQEMFQSEPVKYAPQYGGYCASEVALGSVVTVNIDPEAFKIIDGKLYLIYDKPDAADFATRANELVPKAEANWQAIKPKLEAGSFK
jgi:YHS domain-containing protein